MDRWIDWIELSNSRHDIPRAYRMQDESLKIKCIVHFDYKFNMNKNTWTNADDWTMINILHDLFSLYFFFLLLFFYSFGIMHGQWIPTVVGNNGYWACYFFFRYGKRKVDSFFSVQGISSFRNGFFRRRSLFCIPFHFFFIAFLYEWIFNR